MVRPLINIIGSVFTIITLGAIGFAITIGAVFWIYGRDLPSHESLSQYKPPTISRIYSVEGQIIDEFAKERRLFTPAGEIPNSVKNAFISAEDKNFYSHPGYDVRGIISAIVDAVRSGGQVVRGGVNYNSTSDEELFVRWVPSSRAKNKGNNISDTYRKHPS